MNADAAPLPNHAADYECSSGDQSAKAEWNLCHRRYANQQRSRRRQQSGNFELSEHGNEPRRGGDSGSWSALNPTHLLSRHQPHTPETADAASQAGRSLSGRGDEQQTAVAWGERGGEDVAEEKTDSERHSSLLLHPFAQPWTPLSSVS